MIEIQTRLDQRRGCGWRKPGGLYMVAGGVSAPCGLLPVPLTVCPTCNCGIKPQRSFQWIDLATIVRAAGQRCHSTEAQCYICPLSLESIAGARQGLLWIGGQFYDKPSDWTSEAIRQGVSRRISAVPNDFVIGETWVLVAHRHAIETRPTLTMILAGEERPQVEYTPGIFHAFKPTAIEYVVRGDETEEELERMVKRGITPVQVMRVGDQMDLAAGVEEDETLTEEL